MTTENLTQRTSSDFAQLSRRVADAGLLARRPGYYAFRIALVATLFTGGWVALFALGDSWWALAVAVFQAVMFGQIALLSHDLAHRQVFRTRRPSEIAGWISGNLCVGMSYGWWMDKHTRHHANPNHEELDPDVDPDILVWSKDQARASRGLPRFVGRYQAFLFFPLLTLEGLNLHLSGIRAVLKPTLKHRGLEAALLLAHFALYLSALFVVLSPGKALVFFAVHQGLWGIYMGSIFAPNHKGMPLLTGKPELDFLRKQVLTSRNVEGSHVVDVALGGLNYQVEHHLFPSMPSPHLRRAQPIVEDYCAELGIPYLKTGLIDSYAQALRSLHEAGEPLRKAS
ncbi:fatty acid desaturase family protein [Amycolatopsis sp. H20-H5]|uniref:fatty acid desaturase family protein n=1 Tax=Amycolatopsis sp. H20-H5 TaxID=3046309 RepID=UPI002DB8CDB1|nr:acyl-CoA desaturase [Amycolatopsis sp. H20-H5]MEC3974830.1 acyl-CoA desaturase [Amycolatopsis sp. H20-H5]